MSRTFLIHLAGLAALTAGALRIGTAFTGRILIGDPAELVYLVIDLGLLVGVLGAYLSRLRDLGRLGFAGFAIALPGAASIVGPDGRMFGIELYAVGGAVMILGLALLAITQLRARIGRLGSSLGWLASLAAMAATPLWSVAFIVLGVTFGLAFVALGLELQHETKTA